VGGEGEGKGGEIREKGKKGGEHKRKKGWFCASSCISFVGGIERKNGGVKKEVSQVGEKIKEQ